MVSNLERGMKEEKYILDRVLMLFMRYGIRSVTMDDIARELGVSKKTLYTNFRDKNDLIKRVIAFDRSLSRKFFEKVYEPNSNAIQEIFLVNSRIHSFRSRYSATFYYDLKKYFPGVYRSWIKDKRQNIYKLIIENLQKGKQEGFYRKEINDQTIGSLYMARMEMLDSSEIIKEHESHSNEFMREIFTYHLHGICNEKGLKILSELEEKMENRQDIQL